MRHNYNLGFITDEWQFCGNLSAQYKQIGNAVPVNLAWAIGRSLIRLFNDMVLQGLINHSNPDSHAVHLTKLHGIFEGMACDKPNDYHPLPPQ